MTASSNVWSRVAAADVLDVHSPVDKVWTFHWPGLVVIQPSTDGVEWHAPQERRALAGSVLAAPAFAGHLRIFAPAGAAFRAVFGAAHEREPAFYGRVHHPLLVDVPAQGGDPRGLLDLARAALEDSPPTSCRIPTNLLRAREILSQNLAGEMDLEALATTVGVDRCHLCRSFQKAVGLPPYRFRAHLRVAEARILLAAGYDCTEVAHELGFCDQSHLSRTFKELTGTTPGAYARVCGAARVSRPQLLSAA